MGRALPRASGGTAALATFMWDLWPAARNRRPRCRGPGGGSPGTALLPPLTTRKPSPEGLLACPGPPALGGRKPGNSHSCSAGAVATTGECEPRLGHGGSILEHVCSGPSATLGIKSHLPATAVLGSTCTPLKDQISHPPFQMAVPRRLSSAAEL